MFYLAQLKVFISVLFILFAQTALASDEQTVTSANSNKTVLIVVTNHSDYPSREDKTGLWLTELTHFYDIMKKAGYDLDIASPQGGETPLDERSLGWFYMDSAAKAHLEDESFVERLNATKKASEINPSDYVAIYFAGGHGTMWDFRDNEDLKKIAEQIYNQGGYVTSVCHGAAGLLNLKTPDGKPLIAGKDVTGFSNTEEWLVGVKDQVPFSLQDELVALGADYKKAFLPFFSYTVVDGHLITGQNPNSGKDVAKKLLSSLKSQ